MDGYDVIVIGGGPGGCRAAKVLAAAGKSVALVSQELGGECLNYACIPAKTYLFAAELFEKNAQAQEFGLVIGGNRLDWEAMKTRRERVVEKLKKALRFTLEKTGVKIIEGRGELTDQKTVEIFPLQTTNYKLQTNTVILATGSQAFFPPGFSLNGRVASSREILDLPAVPKTLLIIGGGAVGVEFASVFASLGSQVTIAERSDRLLPREDHEISAELSRVFGRKNIKILTNTTFAPDQTAEFETVLVAAGRRPFSEGLGIEKAGLKTGPAGIETNEYCQTSAAHIFAIGDLAGKALLAYSAEREADITAGVILGKKPEPLRYETLCNTIFSLPEIASVGLTQQAAEEKSLAPIIGKALYSANAKALILGSRDGFAKIVADGSTKKILGVHLIGERATELIAQASLAVTAGMTLEDFSKNIYSHPILGEVLKEACETALSAAALYKK